MPTLSPDAPLPDFLRPSSTYLAPSSGLFFGGQGFGSQGLPSLESLLPARQAGDYLLRQYFAAVHPVARVVHRPSFEADYQVFWSEVMENYEPRASTQAIVFAAWFSAAVSLDEAQVQQDFGLTKEALVDRFKVGTETALSKAKFLKTTRVETIQAFVMYMVGSLDSRLDTISDMTRSLFVGLKFRGLTLCCLLLLSAWQNAWVRELESSW